jgi:hypothetical protein
MTMGDMVNLKKRSKREPSEQQAEGNRNLRVVREHNYLDQHHIRGDAL